VRSHAKAPSAGSNSDWAKSRSFRRSGAFAALLVALMAAACLLPGAAFAAEIRSLTGSFGPDGTSGTSFGFPTALAFDQSNKHLYALDLFPGKLHGFDASTPGSHPPLGGSFPLSQSEVEALDDIAVDSSTHNIFRARLSEGKLLGFDERGAELPGFPVTLGAACGVAVDTLGNVWVAMGYLSQVRQYSPAGALLKTILVAGGSPCSLALDSQNNLYVGLAEGETRKYSSGSNYEVPTPIDPEYTAGLAVDRSTDELYVLHPFSVSVYDNTGNFLYEFGAGGEYFESGGIAIDEATEEVFLTDQSTLKVKVFGPPPPIPKVTAESADGIAATTATLHGTVNPKGQAVEDCHFEAVPNSQFLTSKFNNVTAAQKFPCVPAAGSIPIDSNPHPVTANVTGLQPATVYRYRLVAKNTFGEVKTVDRQFTSGLSTPLVEKESVLAVGNTDATVSASVNPRGGETTYHVEYGTTNAYGQSTSESVPFGFPADNAGHTFSVHIGGLQPGTAYHFRFVATNSAGPTQGTDTTFATYPASASFAPCPNDLFRTGVGARLPDCRAYEQGTPIDKHGANAQVATGAVSASGDRFTFFSNGGLPTSGGSSALLPFLASRGPDGWSTDGFLPSTEPKEVARILGVDEDLSTALVSFAEEEGVVEAGVPRFFLRDSATAAFHTAFVSPAGVGNVNVQGFAADPSHLIFTAQGQLLPGVSGFTNNLYDLDHGTLTVANRIPAGSATSCDDEAGPACVIPPGGSPRNQNHISRDGSRVFFIAKPVGETSLQGRVYMREDGTRTTWVSASQRTTPDPNGEKPAELAGISADGSKVFFKSCEKLTDDSTAFSTAPNECSNSPGETPVQGQDLYSYDVGTGELTDLTVDSNAGDPLGATVRLVLGMSSDGSYIYFIADGVLAPGASPNDNLYVRHGGTTTFVAKVASYEAEPSEIRVSENGVLLFGSGKSFTGYNNVSPACGGACQEFFRYSLSEEKLICVSCNPTGITAAGGAGLSSTGGFITSGQVTNGPSRNLSANGSRVFFESADSLVPSDTNGVRDVYEWEAKGEGSCESESQNGGCLYLISSGTSPTRSTFLGASKNGDHVFFFTEQQLVPTDEDQLYDVYDAGTGDGLAAQHVLSPPTCSSTACQANPPPPPDPSLASAAYSGAGNTHRPSKARKCPQGKRKVRSGGKTRCQKAHKQHKRHNNRGGSK
jgi:hypothetical protein